MRRGFLFVCLAAAAQLVACAQEEAPEAAGYQPAPPQPAPLVDPQQTPQPELLDMDTLASVRPRLRREGDYIWRRRHTSVPGHYGAHLVTSQGRKPVLLLTVDDLLHRPDRVAWLRSAGAEALPGVPADIARGSWIRALVADRYEVALVAQEELGQDHEALLDWFGQLRIKKLLQDEGRK